MGEKSPADRLHFTQDIAKQAGSHNSTAKKRHDRPLSSSALGRSKNAPACQILPKGFNKAEYYKKLIDQMLCTNVSISELEQVYVECQKSDCVPNNDLRRVMKKIMKLKRRQRLEIELEQRKRALSLERQTRGAALREVPHPFRPLGRTEQSEDHPTSSAHPDSSHFRHEADSRLHLPTEKPRKSIEHQRYDETVKTIKPGLNEKPHIVIEAESDHPQVLVAPLADTSLEPLFENTIPNPHEAMESTIKDQPSSKELPKPDPKSSKESPNSDPPSAASPPSPSSKKAAMMLRNGLQNGDLSKIIDVQLNGGNGITAPQKAAVLLKRGIVSGKLAQILSTF